MLTACLLACCGCLPTVFDGLESDDASSSQRSDPMDAGGGGALDAGADAPEPDEDDAETSDTGGPGDAATPDAACLDTVRDRFNCGSCGFDCSASSAMVDCINSRCARQCDATHDDCNDDLALGTDGDGCETRIDNDTMNCGGCDVRCVASAYGFVSCKERCIEHSIKLTSPRPGPLNGSATGGEPFKTPQLCGLNEVLIGISGVGDTITYSLVVHCARLALDRTATGYGVRIVETHTSEAVGGLIGPEPPPPFERRCRAGSIVTGVSGATWLWPGQTTHSIRQITLQCSTPSVNAARQLALTADLPVTIGDTNDPSVMSFSEDCAEGGAVAGFTGRAGAYIDSIATHCGMLVIGDDPAPTSRPEQ